MTTSPSQTNKTFLQKYEWIVPLGLFIFFLAVTLPGISWGAPSIWHPDEIVVRSIKALNGEWQFSKTNFDYPDLPQYVMYFLGKVVLRLGYSNGEVLIASRVLSAVVAGMAIVVTYITTRRMGGNIYIAGLSGLLLLCVSEMEHNGRFAHNDTYITFFATLTALFLVQYKRSNRNIWLYASFVSVGMAASSKYNGISLVLAPIVIYLLTQKQPIQILKTLSLGAILTFLGFAIGTPRALLEMPFYFQHMIPALIHTGNFNRQPDSLIGIVGQYAVLAEGLGIALFLLFSAGLLWLLYRTIQNSRITGVVQETATIGFPAIPLLIILALDLPILVSYNYPIRFFLPIMPMLATTAAFFVGHFYDFLKEYGAIYQRLVIVTVGLVFLISMARITSLMLLFIHDARIPASEYILSLPRKASLEYTLYPPTIPKKHFRREFSYPIYFVKVQGDPIPTSDKYTFNVGEAGLDERKTTYLVVDSFTSDKFKDPFTCNNMQVECDFFKQLETGQSDHYRLIEKFSYSLPSYLPQIKALFVNPEIRIYERFE